MVNKRIKNCFIKPIFLDLHKDFIQIHSIEIFKERRPKDLAKERAKFIIIGFYNKPLEKNKC